VRTLNGTGIQPDFIVARADKPLDDKRKEKIGIFCNVRTEDVISAPDVETIYDVPLNFERDHLSDLVLAKLGLKAKQVSDGKWAKQVKKLKSAKTEVKVAIVGKYFKTGDYVLTDAYISVIEALKHAACAEGAKLKLDWLDSTEFEEDPKKVSELKAYDGVLIPGGFGSRGIEGKIKVIEYCRKNKIPYFGLCYGMQLMVIEFARNVAGLKGAHTAEVNAKAPYVVVDIMPEQKAKLAKRDYGATMRLGQYEAMIKKGTQAAGAYKSASVLERHRHRYEINPEYIEAIEKKGLVFSGTSPDSRLMEIAELPKSVHPFFLATQFHPEFQSSLLHPHPLFVAFMKACK
jgi:CTP synthase